MKKRDIISTIYEYDSIDELSVEDKSLIQDAKDATRDSYSPYSHFRVGAAVLLENGKVIKGSNQENAAYPSGLCAERVAMFYANSNYPNVAVKAIAVATVGNNNSADTVVPPCGACRQVLVETEQRFKKPIRVLLSGKSKVFEIKDVEQLLPISFDGSFLK